MHHLDIGQMAEQHAVAVQRALRIAGGARGVDDDRRVIAGCIDRLEFFRSVLDRSPERPTARLGRIGDDIDVAQLRQPVADLDQLLPAADVGDDRLGAGIVEAIFERVLAEQREQRHRHQPRTKRGKVHNRQFYGLRQEHRDTVATDEAIVLQHIGETTRGIGKRIEAEILGRLALIDQDHRQPVAAIGVAVAGDGRDIEMPHRRPAEIAIERLVITGFDEQGTSLPDRFLSHAFSVSRRLPRCIGGDDGNCYAVNAALTRPLALPKSIWPTYLAFSSAMTLPMSFMPAAPVSAMIVAMAAFTSSSDICLGK